MVYDENGTALSRTLAATQTMQMAGIHALDAFSTPIEERFERLTRLGQRALRVPVIAITAITEDRQWFKSVLGWNISELSLEKSLCRRVVKTGKAAFVGDLTKHPRYAAHPLVVKKPKFRFYCGLPLHNAHGTVIGTVCVIGRKPRAVPQRDVRLLTDIALLAERELLTIELQTAQAALISKLSVARRQALIDPLTKTWNRRGGEMLIEEALGQAASDGNDLAVLAVDVDDFKQVNDSFGHAIGDKALRLVARELLACVRGSDGVCRYGGDEFFVVLANVDRESVKRIAKRTQKAIERSMLANGDGRRAGISVSIGIGHTESPGETTAEELLDAADRSLYEEKIRRSMQVDLA